MRACRPKIPSTAGSLAIMFTDMVGYSALSQRNEALALLSLHVCFLTLIFPHKGGSRLGDPDPKQPGVLLSGVDNLHRLRVPLAPVVHLEHMLIRADDAQDRFHWNVPATGGRAVGFSFHRDDLIAAVGLAFTDEHRGLIVAHPNAVDDRTWAEPAVFVHKRQFS